VNDQQIDRPPLGELGLPIGPAPGYAIGLDRRSEAFEQAGGSAVSDGGLQDRLGTLQIGTSTGHITLIAQDPAEAVERAAHPWVVVVRDQDQAGGNPAPDSRRRQVSVAGWCSGRSATGFKAK
jgi:hypothetical protein